MHDSAVALDFYGARLRIQSRSRHLVQMFERMYAEFADRADPAGGGFTLWMEETGAPFVNHDLPLTYQGRFPDGQVGGVWESGDVSIIAVREDCTIVIDHSSQHAHVRMRPGRAAAFFGTAAMSLIDAALASAGQQLVHAASLVCGASGKAILFCAPSGGGKTTTALALAHGGFTMMSDDASVLVGRDGGFAAWGMPRPLKIHVDTMRLLPWLGSINGEWDENGERGVEPGDLKGRIVRAPVGLVELGAIVIIGPRSVGGHSFEPLSKRDALAAIASENIAWRPTGMTPKAIRCYETLARAVASVPTFTLSVGTELDRLPNLLSDMLPSCRDPAP